MTLEPCAHHGTTPPCTDAILAAGVERVVFGARDPNPEAAGGEELPARSRRRRRVRRLVRGARAERGVAHVGDEAAAVRHLQGGDHARRPRDACPAGAGSAARRAGALVHELRAEVDAVAVGGGTARADRPRLDARDVETPRGQPRRLVFSRGPLPEGLDLELRTGPLDGRAARARRGGRPVAPPRGWADARGRVLRGRSRRQGAPLRRARCSAARGRRSRLRYPPRAR